MLTSSTASRALPSPSAIIGAALLAVASLGVMANALVAAALPGIRAHFADTPRIDELVGLVVTLPSIGIVLTAGAAGWLNDRFGRQPVMLGALLLYGIAGLGALLTTSFTALLVTRFLLGVAIGGTMTSAMAMIGDRYTGEARVRFMSTQAAVMSAASMLFLVAGGVLGELSWRHPFLLYGMGLLMIPVALALLPESRPPGPVEGARDRLDVKPLLVVGLSAFIAMVLFYLLPVRLPFHLQAVGITSPAIAGLTVAVATATMATMAMLYARFGARLAPFTVYALIFSLTAVGFLLIGWSTSLPGIVLGAAIAGAGYGWLWPVNNLLILKRAPAQQRGRATGFHTTCIFTGQFISPIISGPLSVQVSTGPTFVIFAGIAALVAVGYLLARARRPVTGPIEAR
jgi:MFS family permease